ncbi:AfsA-related hotdog domain-containing protein [Rothia dentocariosa]
MSTRQPPEDAPQAAGRASADPRYAAFLGCAYHPGPGTAPDADLTQAEKPAAEDPANDGEYRVFLRYDTRIAPDVSGPVTLSVTDVEYLQDLHRQGIEALGREALGVKSDDHFVLRGAGLTFTPHILGGDVRGSDTTGTDEPIELSLHVPVSTIRRRRGQPCYAISGAITLWAGDTCLAESDGAALFLTADTFEELRGELGDTAEIQDATVAGGASAEPPKAVRVWGTPYGHVQAAPAHLCGVSDASQVLVGDVHHDDTAHGTETVQKQAEEPRKKTLERSLQNPPGAPVLAQCRIVPTAPPRHFDRPLDHYPGLMMASAARQFAVAALAHRTGEDPANLRVAEETHEFFEFVELTEIPTLNLLRCEKHRDTYQTEITVNQGGAVKARSRFTFI